MKMTGKELRKKQNELEARGVSDDDNPYFALSGLNTSVLRMVCEGRVDLNVIAEATLECRGLTIPKKKYYRSYDISGDPIRVTVPE